MGRNSLISLSSLMLGVFYFHSAHSHSPTCEVLMSPFDGGDSFGEYTFDETEKLIAYLTSLLERNLIGDEELSDLISELKEGQVINPFRNRNDSAAEIHGKGIQKHIDGASLDQDWLLDWAEQKLREKKRVRVRRGETHQRTRSFFQEIEFHPVRVGSFQMGKKNEIPVDLHYPIEVMSTPVTQAQWVELMGKNPSSYAAGEHSIVVLYNGKMIRMQPDNPVENITWWSALVFANRLSEKYGLRPVYDLSGTTLKKGTRAESGTLDAQNKKVKIRTRSGIHDPYKMATYVYYQAEGFRLPTEAEQEYLLRGGGLARGKYHFGDDEAKLKDYAWYKDNSGDKTHPVAELKPLVLGGKSFYDLHGNVWEWSWDWNGELLGGDNPLGEPWIYIKKTGRGGCFRGSAEAQCSHRRCPLLDDIPNCLTGFRLVRTIRSSR